MGFFSFLATVFTLGLAAKAAKGSSDESSSRKQSQTHRRFSYSNTGYDYNEKYREEQRRENTYCSFNPPITYERFCFLATQAGKRIKRLYIDVNGPTVIGDVTTTSGINHWTFKISFNDYGNISGRYWFLEHGNYDSSIPEVYADMLQRAIEDDIRRYNGEYSSSASGSSSSYGDGRTDSEYEDVDYDFDDEDDEESDYDEEVMDEDDDDDEEEEEDEEEWNVDSVIDTQDLRRKTQYVLRLIDLEGSKYSIETLLDSILTVKKYFSTRSKTGKQLIGQLIHSYEIPTHTEEFTILLDTLLNTYKNENAFIQEKWKEKFVCIKRMYKRVFRSNFAISRKYRQLKRLLYGDHRPLIISMSVIFCLLASGIGTCLYFEYRIPDPPSPEHTIYLENGYSHFKGKDYTEVQTYFVDKGFTNITLDPMKDMVLGWFNTENEVDKVTIDGNDKFESKTWYIPTVPVVISYHSYK